jgi:hypothetical protein
MWRAENGNDVKIVNFKLSNLDIFENIWNILNYSIKVKKSYFR